MLKQKFLGEGGGLQKNAGKFYDWGEFSSHYQLDFFILAVYSPIYFDFFVGFNNVKIVLKSSKVFRYHVCR